MAATIFWKNEDPTATGFTLTRSSDGGIVYSAVATIVANTLGANYDAATRQFFYADASAAPGDIFKITATGPNGTSPAVLAAVPPAAPAMCTLIGYALNGLGGADRKAVVLVSTLAGRDGAWLPNATGVVARQGDAVCALPTTKTLYPDANGMWSVDLAQGAVARVAIPSAEFEVTFRVPGTAGPLNVRDVTALRGQELEQYGPATMPLAFDFG